MRAEGHGGKEEGSGDSHCKHRAKGSKQPGPAHLKPEQFCLERESWQDALS